MVRPRVIAAAVVLAVAGCVATPAPTPATSAIPTTIPTPTPVPGGSAAPSPSLPGQTDTAFGRIWDAIPPSFPMPDGGVPGDVGQDPASAAIEFPAAAGDEFAVAHRFYDAFDQAGMVVTLDGPREDGAYVVTTGTQADPCHIQVSVMPLGATTEATILYGAGCPFE